MRFSDLCIDNYGVCRELNFQELRPGMLVIYGPNEAGKTTTMEFIRETLFGNGPAALSPHVIAPNQSQSGEIRAVDDEGNHWQVRRSSGTNPTLEIVINGQLHPSSSLNRDLLGGIGPQVFHNVFTVGIGELQELNQLNATGAATYLYEMTTGFDRVSLGNVLRRVTSERQKLENQDGAGVLVELREEYARTKTKLDSHHLKITDWASCHNGITSVKKQLVDLDLRSADLNLRKRNLDVALILHGRHVELRQLDQLIASAQAPNTLKNSPVFTQLEELVTLASDAELMQQQIFEDEAKLVEFEVAYKTLQTQLIPHELWLRIQAFQELLPWLKSLSRDVLEIEETDLLSSSPKQHRSHSPEPSRDLDLSVLSHRLLKELRQPAKEVRHTRSQLTKVQNELKEVSNQLATQEKDWLENPAWDS
ncbi:MAG: AAA family ATPase, partial [Planctomycetota bacterium]|nr:AAA family ATPase [Planctomycetota bacterium]